MSREFQTKYNESVANIKLLKTYNDRLSKSIGITNDISLYYEVQNQSDEIGQICSQIEEQIKKMQKSYLDPDTARKIGMIRQQLTLQRD